MDTDLVVSLSERKGVSIISQNIELFQKTGSLLNNVLSHYQGSTKNVVPSEMWLGLLYSDRTAALGCVLDVLV